MQGSGYGNSLVTGSVPFGHGSGGSLPHQAVPGTNMPHSPVVMPSGGSTMSKVNTSASGCAHAVASAISASDDASSGVPTPEEGGYIHCKMFPYMQEGDLSPVDLVSIIISITGML